MSGTRIETCKAFLNKFLRLLINNNFEDITLLNFKEKCKTMHIDKKVSVTEVVNSLEASGGTNFTESFFSIINELK